MKQFFEVIQGTKVGKIEKKFNCNNPECNKNQKNRLVAQLASKEYNCNACGGTVSEFTVNLPPLSIGPEEVVGNDLSYNFEISGKYKVVLYFLTLVAVFDTMKKHFRFYFRLDSRQWFKCDGLNTPAVSTLDTRQWFKYDGLNTPAVSRPFSLP